MWVKKCYDPNLNDYHLGVIEGKTVAVYKNANAIKKLKNNGVFNLVEGKWEGAVEIQPFQ